MKAWSWTWLAFAALLASCSAPEAPRAPAQPSAPAAPLTITPPADRADAPVVRRELPTTPQQPIPAQPPVTAAPIAPAIDLPAGAIYVCVIDREGTRRQTVIEFTSPRVLELCRKHPEMGPCQYERNVCRGAGGRVFASGAQEITLATEAEYDRKVMRVRFRAN
ncbi:MAG TPA: hypothetical protein VNE58_08240 [Casimicrobiaceae bacterium]|nr:hypothetical protein [Casimicrobiaceae bacterium]